MDFKHQPAIIQDLVVKYSKFYRLFVTPSAPGAVKSVRCAFFFELLELIKTKITSLICFTTVLDKNLDFWNKKVGETDFLKISILSLDPYLAQS